MHVREMTITLDDVVCLLDIPITWRLIEEEEELDHDHGIELLQDELFFTNADVRAEVKKTVRCSCQLH